MFQIRWKTWLALLAVILLFTLVPVCALWYLHKFLVSVIVLGLGLAFTYLWVAWGLWVWRHVLWVRRTGWFYLTTTGVVATGGIFLLFHLQTLALCLVGGWVMLVIFILGLRLIRAILAPGWPVLGVARTLIDEAIRMKIALIFIVLLALMVPWLPQMLDRAERLQYRLQFFLTWSVSGVSLLLSLMTIFLACGTICDEIKQRQIFLTMTKPVGRWQYILGKWLGIILLDLLLLVVAGAAIFLIAFMLRFRPAINRVDREAVERQVFTARTSVEASYPPDLFSPEAVRARLKTMRESDADPPKGDSPTPIEYAAIQKWIEGRWHSIAPHESETYLFTGLEHAKSFGRVVQLRLKGTTAPEPQDKRMPVLVWLNGIAWPAQGGNQYPLILTSGEYDVIDLPAEAINDKGELAVKMQNIFLPTSISLESGSSMEVLYQVDTFPPNYVRTLAIIWVKLVFLAMLGLAAGTFLGFPVACLMTLVLFVGAEFSGFVSSSLSSYGVPVDASGQITLQGTWAAFSGSIVHGEFLQTGSIIVGSFDLALVHSLSAFSRFDPVPLLCDGRIVSNEMLGSSILWLVVGWTLVCGLIAGWIFHHRELARVTV